MNISLFGLAFITWFGLASSACAFLQNDRAWCQVTRDLSQWKKGCNEAKSWLSSNRDIFPDIRFSGYRFHRAAYGCRVWRGLFRGGQWESALS